jgi:hypothetical protein
MTGEERLEIINRLSNEKVKTYPLGYFRSWDIKSTRKPYQKLIESILVELYSEFMDDRGKIINVPNEDTEYSFLNYVNTNYSAFAIIVNWVNKIIVNSSKNNRIIASRQLNFNEDRTNWEDEMELTLILIDKYKHYIFLPETDAYKNLKRVVGSTIKRGYTSEEKMKKFIKIKFPYATNFVTGGHGEEEDMQKGIDLTFTLNGKTVTTQHKRCRNVDEKEYFYFINGVGGIKEYDIDCLSFEDKDGNLFLFKNRDTKIVDNQEGKSYLIPKDNLVIKS